MSKSFLEHPILNSPYAVPTRHHALDKDGQPLDQTPTAERRRSELITPVPKPRKQHKKAGADQYFPTRMASPHPNKSTNRPRSSTRSASTSRHGATVDRLMISAIRPGSEFIADFSKS